MNIIIFIVLFAAHCPNMNNTMLIQNSPDWGYSFSSGYTEAKIKVCKTLDEVNKLSLQSDTEVYTYEFKTNTLTKLAIQPIKETIKIPEKEREIIKGYRVEEIK